MQGIRAAAVDTIRAALIGAYLLMYGGYGQGKMEKSIVYISALIVGIKPSQ